MKKPVKQTRSRAKKAQPVYWVRLINGDEFITRVKKTAGGYDLLNPTIITTIRNTMILAPYGLLGKEQVISVGKNAVLHVTEVSASAAELYSASTDATNMRVVQDYFEVTLQRSIEQAREPLISSAETPRVQVIAEDGSVAGEANIDDATAKIIAELSESLDETLGRPPEFDGVAPKDAPRTRNQTIDDLVKLAEKAGKGKKKA